MISRVAIWSGIVALCWALAGAAQTPHQQALNIVAAEIGLELADNSMKDLRKNLRSLGYSKTKELYDKKVVPAYETWENSSGQPFDRVHVTACGSDWAFPDVIAISTPVRSDDKNIVALRDALERAKLLREAEKHKTVVWNRVSKDATIHPQTPPKATEHGKIRYLQFGISARQPQANGDIYYDASIHAGFVCPRYY